MPVLLETDKLKSGMRLARAVIDHGETILPADITLKTGDVDELNRRHLTVQVAVRDPLLDDNVSFQDDSAEAEIPEVINELCSPLASQLQRVLPRQQCLTSADFHAVESTITTIIAQIQRPNRSCALISNANGEECGETSGSVVQLALVTGGAVIDCLTQAKSPGSEDASARVRNSTPDLHPLGVAAFLRDVALWTEMGAEPIAHRAPLTDTQHKVIYEHPLRGAKILPPQAKRATVTAIQYHHENNCGTGYPQQTPRENIPLFARILRVADAYHAAISLPCEGGRHSPIRALWEMTCGPASPCFDPAVLKIFRAVVQPYPIGAKIRLVSGEFAVVVRYGKIHGLLPEVVIAFDADDTPLPERDIRGPFRLEYHPEVSPASFRGEDLSNFYGAQHVYYDDCPKPYAFTTLAESIYP